MVAHSTVNRVVTGSSPVTGAKDKKGRFPYIKGSGLFYLENLLSLDRDVKCKF